MKSIATSAVTGLLIGLFACSTSSVDAQTLTNQFTFGGNVFTPADDMILSPDNDIILCGNVPTGSSNPETRLYKVTPEGDEIWGFDVGNTQPETTFPGCMAVMSNGDLATLMHTGYSSQETNAWLLNIITQDGFLVSYQNYLTGSNMRPSGMIATSDGGLLLAGEMPNGTASTFTYIKTDSQGVEEWRAQFAPPPGSAEITFGLDERADGSFVGFYQCIDPETTNLCIGVHAMNSFGSLLPEARIAGAGDFALRSVIATSDNSYLAMGGSLQSGGDTVKVMKFSSDFEVQWLYTLAPDDAHIYYARAGAETADGGYVIACQQTDKDTLEMEEIRLLRLSQHGNLYWSSEINAPVNRLVRGIEASVEDEFHIHCHERTGWLSGTHWVGTVRDNSVTVEELPAEAANQPISVWPQPASGPVTIQFKNPAAGTAQLEIFDMTGKHVCAITQPVASGSQLLHWDGTDASGNSLPGGLYLYRLTTNATRHTGRLVIER